jgi:hypothetical protein
MSVMEMGRGEYSEPFYFAVNDHRKRHSYRGAGYVQQMPVMGIFNVTKNYLLGVKTLFLFVSGSCRMFTMLLCCRFLGIRKRIKSTYAKSNNKCYQSMFEQIQGNHRFLKFCAKIADLLSKR